MQIIEVKVLNCNCTRTRENIYIYFYDLTLFETDLNQKISIISEAVVTTDKTTVSKIVVCISPFRMQMVCN